MSLTIATYDVDFGTGQRTLRRARYEVRPLKVAEASTAWPACQCPIHRKVSPPRRR